MEEFEHPRVVVGVDGSLSGLAAIRTAVAEARRRGLPLLGVRARTSGMTGVDSSIMTTAFLEALGAIPADLELELRVSWLSISEALCAAAGHPGDLIVVGISGKGWWHAICSGSAAFAVGRRARCPVLAVPAPEMSRAVRRPHRRRARSQWDPLRELEEQRPEFHGRPYSGI
jgi:nucleotide-binding universal stress UspA family protein